MSGLLQLPTIEVPRLPTVTEQVFDGLYHQVMTGELPPGTRLSEADVAKALGVSRQPVRDAFWRLSQLGFLMVRPQRATIVSPISEPAVRRAQFIRIALEVETIRLAVERFTTADLDAIGAQLEEQVQEAASGTRERFFELDEEFHREICERAGVGFTWSLIREQKAHMDRVRFLSLAFNTGEVLREHRAIFDGLVARDVEACTTAMREHMRRIDSVIARVRLTHPGLFGAEE
jgi:DNA-binding GntR family transcriptional regulator